MQKRTIPLCPYGVAYRGTSLIRNRPLLGPYSRTMSGGLWWPYGGGGVLMSEIPLLPLFLMSEVPLY